jgi:hypothetical protein
MVQEFQELLGARHHEQQRNQDHQKQGLPGILLEPVVLPVSAPIHLKRSLDTGSFAGEARDFCLQSSGSRFPNIFLSPVYQVFPLSVLYMIGLWVSPEAPLPIMKLDNPCPGSESDGRRQP